MKVVQIGAAGHYAYALATMKKYEMDFAAVCYPDAEDGAERAKRIFGRFGFSPRVYDDAEEMMKNEMPDIAIVNTVMYENSRYASMALEMGISVFCEKPVATTMENLENLIHTYKEAKAKKENLCFCGMFGIDYLPHFETAYRFVKAGSIGEVMLANGQKSYRMGRREKFYSDREKYGGTIPWVAIHAIEWITRIGGLRPAVATACGNTACNAGNGTMEASTLSLFACEKGKIAAVFSGDDASGYKYAYGSVQTDIRPLGKALNTALNGRGGGSAALVQGGVRADAEAIRAYFQALEV